MTVAIPASGEIIILSMEYDPTGLAWVRLYDNHALGWLVDEVMGAPIVPLYAAGDVPGFRKPVTTGARAVSDHPRPLAQPAPTPRPSSPQWAKFADPVVFVPDPCGCGLPDFLTWLATNNRAQRVIGSMLGLDRNLLNAYNQWAAKQSCPRFSDDPP
jgi:hypothetical protein